MQLKKAKTMTTAADILKDINNIKNQSTTLKSLNKDGLLNDQEQRFLNECLRYLENVKTTKDVKDNYKNIPKAISFIKETINLPKGCLSLKKEGKTALNACQSLAGDLYKPIYSNQVFEDNRIASLAQKQLKQFEENLPPGKDYGHMGEERLRTIKRLINENAFTHSDPGEFKYQKKTFSDMLADVGKKVEEFTKSQKKHIDIKFNWRNKSISGVPDYIDDQRDRETDEPLMKNAHKAIYQRDIKEELLGSAEHLEFEKSISNKVGEALQRVQQMLFDFLNSPQKLSMACQMFTNFFKKKETKTTNAKRTPEWIKSKDDWKKELTTKSVEQLKEIIEARKYLIQMHYNTYPQNVETANLLKKICKIDTTEMNKKQLESLNKLVNDTLHKTSKANYGDDPFDKEMRTEIEADLDSITQEPKGSSFRPS